MCLMKALTYGTSSTLKFRLLLWCDNDLNELVILDRLCFTNLFISAIRISVNSHIGAPLQISHTYTV